MNESGANIERFGEHVFRVSGAQFLSRRNVQVYLIQLLGRWGSDAVFRYIQEAPLSLTSCLARQVFPKHALVAICDEPCSSSSRASPDGEDRGKDIQTSFDFSTAFKSLEAEVAGMKLKMK